MPTQEQLNEIAKYIGENYPDFHFLILMTPKENPLGIAIASNLQRHLQPILAEAFVTSVQGLKKGIGHEINLNKTH
jgi:hypothetical protein